MLLLPFAGDPAAGPVLALASTLAGNFLIVGSGASIVVVDAAGRHRVVIDWPRRARTGLPVTATRLAPAALWLFCGGS